MQPRQFNNSNGNNANNSNGNKDLNLIPEGAHVARVVLIAFIGGLEKEYQGKKQVRDTVLISYELTDEVREYNGEKYKMIITREYGFNYSEKGHLRRDIEAMLARKLSDAEVDYNSPDLFKINTILDTPCMITVVHEKWQSKDGTKNGVNQEVSAVSALPTKMKEMTEPAQRKLVAFDVSQFSSLNDLFNDDSYKNLNKFVKAKLEQSKDYKDLLEMHKASGGNNQTTQTNQPPVTNQNNTTVSSNPDDSMCDDLPF